MDLGGWNYDIRIPGRWQDSQGNCEERSKKTSSGDGLVDVEEQEQGARMCCA